MHPSILSLLLNVALLRSITPLTTQPTTPACQILTAAEVTDLVGGGSRAIPIATSAHGGSCMYQNLEKIATVLLAVQETPESAANLFGAKKRIVQGTDVADLGVAAYAGMMGDAPAVGMVKGVRFVEVRLIDKTTKQPDLSKRLHNALKGAASRMP